MCIYINISTYTCTYTCIHIHIYIYIYIHIDHSIAERTLFFCIHACNIWMRDVAHVNESCHKYEWVMSQIWMSHVSHINEVSHMNESHHTYEWVMSRMWMSHVPHVNESCPACEWGISHIWMSRVTRMDESRHTYEWITAHIWMSHVTFMVTHMNKSRPTAWLQVLKANESCYVTHMNELWPTHARVMSHRQIPSAQGQWVILRHTHERETAHTWTSHVSQPDTKCSMYRVPALLKQHVSLRYTCACVCVCVGGVGWVLVLCMCV